MKTLLGGRFARNLWAYAASEAAAKASRLLVVVAVARLLDPAAIGVAAAALAASEILKALTENGVGQRIIAAPDRELDATCNTAHRIFWLWCLGLFGLQMAIGAALYLANGDAMLFALIAILAAEYLFMPAGLVPCALAMREGKLRQTATIAGAQIVGANLATVLLTLLWPSPVALILPKLLSAPLWLVAMRRLRPWRPAPQAGFAALRPFVTFGGAVLGTELVQALRLHADKIVVGALMGAEALGLYFMAFNAGLGLTNSFTVAFSKVVFPHICQSGDRRRAVGQALLLALGVLTPAVILQALAAPHYVPLLYGPGWEGISEVVSILCLAAIPGLVWSAAAQWLRAHDRAVEEFAVSVILTAALLANTALLAGHGLTAVATGYLAVATAVQLGAAAFILMGATAARRAGA